MAFLKMKEATTPNVEPRETAKRLSTTRILNERIPLAPPELEVIDTFIHFARVTGVPRSLAEIFGLLFVSSQPIPSDEVVNRLNLSAGAASKGLRQLKGMGAIRSVYVAGDRRDHYAVETGTGVAAAFFRAQIRNHTANGAERLERLSCLVHADETQSFSGIGFLQERVKVLLGWHGEIAKLGAAPGEGGELRNVPAPSRQRSSSAARFPRSAPSLTQRIRSGDGCSVP